MNDRPTIQPRGTIRVAFVALVVAAGCSVPGSDDYGEPSGSTSESLSGEVRLFGSSDKPNRFPDSDSQAVEVGLRFRADVAGTVNGVRFLKASANKGTHVGHLWSNTGALLGSVTFGGESTSGWQTARFATPVAINANTTYVVSYHMTGGHYASSDDAFASGGLDRAPLHALRDGQDGPNGVYHYGSSAFPTDTFHSANYFVDVVFAPAPTTTLPPPPPTGTSPPPPPPPPPSSGWLQPSTPASTAPCDLHATPSNLATQFSAAAAGQVLCLAAGTYTDFRGGVKSGVVTLRPESGAAVTMSIDFNGAQNIRIDGVTFSDASLLNTTKNITITRSKFTAPTVIDGIYDGNILFDGNTHSGIMTCASCQPAMIHLAYGDAAHVSGMTIQNSLFSDGDADGIQTGIAVTILSNEFRNIHETGPDDPAHTDSIQIFGSGTVVRGNWVHDNADGIVAYDGIDHAFIEDNVVDLVSGRFGIELYSDTGSIVRHNTLRYATTCEYTPCGDIFLDRKTSDPAGTGTIVVDNIATQIGLSDGSTAAQVSHNMLPSSPGAGNFAGVPIYVGGAAPTSYAGYRLAAGSPGIGAASDGTNVGIH